MRSKNPHSLFSENKKNSKEGSTSKKGYDKKEGGTNKEGYGNKEERPGKSSKFAEYDKPWKNDNLKTHNKTRKTNDFRKEDNFKKDQKYRKNEHFRNLSHSGKEDLNENPEGQGLNKPVQEENPVFSSILFKHASIRSAGFPESDARSIEPFAHLEYKNELKYKNEALAEFWKLYLLPEKPEKIIPSPKERRYRTTTKRRLVLREDKFFLVFHEENKTSSGSFFMRSELEPEEHNTIYKFLIEKINLPSYKTVGYNMNYLIIRGSYTEFAVIFNVHTLTGAVVNKIKLLSEMLKELKINVVSAFIYLDQTKSDYYLEALRPQDQLSFKKLFGPDKLFLKASDKKLSFYPTAFSQVNESIVPVMINTVRDMLLPSEAGRFIDLYCGYGLFSHFMADSFRETIGIDAAGPSIKSAIENSAFLSHKSRVKFFPKRITAESLEATLPDDQDMGEIFLLDPPRQGTENGVIKFIAEREPLKIVHIFCGIDQIPIELKLWKKNGYIVEKVIPLDMFPGTQNLEILISLTREK